MSRRKKSRFLEAVDKAVTSRAGLGEQQLEARLLPLDTISTDDGQPRRGIDPNSEDMVSLRHSIRAHGVLEPVLVIEAAEPRRYQLVAGHRRLIASRAEKRSHIPARILPLQGDMLPRIRLIQLTENLQRKDLWPLEVSATISELKERLGLNQADLGREIGLSQSAVSQYLSLKRLDAESLSIIEAQPEIFPLAFLRALAKQPVAARAAAIKAQRRLQLRAQELDRNGQLPQGTGPQAPRTWRPRVQFQHSQLEFQMVRARRRKGRSITIEVPEDLSHDEIIEAFRGIVGTLRDVHLDRLDIPVDENPDKTSA